MDKANHQRIPTMQDSLKVLIDCGIEINTILDVGILTATQPLIEAFPHIKHHLFEPVDLHFTQIQNNYRNIKHDLHHIALSDQDGEVYLACKAINNDGKITHSEIVEHEITESDMPGLVNCKKIRRARLDAIVGETEIKTPFLLKIDVDGHEMPILKGANATLEKTAVVVIEAPLNKSKLPHFFERAMYLMDKGFYLIDIVDLAYYDGVLWQADLIFVRKNLVDKNERLKPFEAESFSFEKEKWCPLSSQYFKEIQ